jgi:uroporphyrin-3 C-methyltransferase
MNELSTSIESDPPLPPPTANEHVAASTAIDERAEKKSRAPRLVYAGIGGLALLLAAQWWFSRLEISSLREEMARRLQRGDTMNEETKAIVKTLQDTWREQQAKVSVLESKQTESQSQQLALEQMYQDLSKNRDDWALSEIEQVLSTASQQLQLAGNVQGALIALQNADNRLSRSDKPQFITIRRAIAKDMDRLKALPSLDITGIALHLDNIIGQIDAMPLLADEKPMPPASQPKHAGAGSRKAGVSGKVDSANAGSEWLGVIGDKWNGLLDEIWSELGQLIRVRNVETSDALLLSPTQAYYARENLKLRLLNVRLALLSRSEYTFRSDLKAAQDTIGKYFDPSARQTQTVQTLLKQIQSANLSIEMPTLAESLNAVRNYKVKS